MSGIENRSLNLASCGWLLRYEKSSVVGVQFGFCWREIKVGNKMKKLKLRNFGKSGKSEDRVVRSM